MLFLSINLKYKQSTKSGFKTFIVIVDPSNTHNHCLLDDDRNTGLESLMRIEATKAKTTSTLTQQLLHHMSKEWPTQPALPPTTLKIFNQGDLKCMNKDAKRKLSSEILLRLGGEVKIRSKLSFV